MCVRAVCVCACVHVCGLLYRSLTHTRKPHKNSRLYCADIGSGGTRCASDATAATTGEKRTHSTSESTEHDSVGERGERGSRGGWNGGERGRARNERESERGRESALAREGDLLVREEAGSGYKETLSRDRETLLDTGQFRQRENLIEEEREREKGREGEGEGERAAREGGDEQCAASVSSYRSLYAAN